MGRFLCTILCVITMVVGFCILSENLKGMKAEFLEVKNDIQNLSVLSVADLDNYVFSDELKEVISASVESSLCEKEDNAERTDATVAWQLAKQYVSSDFEKANYFYLNALNKEPGNYEIWKDYVSNALDYCDVDSLSLIYSNLDVAIMSTDALYIAKMVELKTSVLDQIISLGLEIETDEISTEVVQESVSSIFLNSEEFLASCANFLASFEDSEISYDLIGDQYSELSVAYCDIASSEADAAFTEASTVMDLFESIIELQSYGEYIRANADTFVDLINALNLYNTTKSSLQYTYGCLGKSYKLIDSELNKLTIVWTKVEIIASLNLRQYLSNERPELTNDNSKSVEELYEYQLFVQELLQIVGSQIDFYNILNSEMLWISNSLDDITITRQKNYQRWAYSVLVNVRALKVSKSSSADFQDFISIDCSLLIPELNVIYSDVYSNLSKNLKDFDALIQFNAENGLRTLEDF